MEPHPHWWTGNADPLVMWLLTPGWRNQSSGSFWTGMVAARPGMAAAETQVLQAIHELQPFLAGLLTCR